MLFKKCDKEMIRVKGHTRSQGIIRPLSCTFHIPLSFPFTFLNVVHQCLALSLLTITDTAFTRTDNTTLSHRIGVNAPSISSHRRHSPDCHRKVLQHQQAYFDPLLKHPPDLCLFDMISNKSFCLIR